MSKFNGIKVGDVVRVKFKPIPEITKEMKMKGKLDFFSEYEIGSNINALMLGGDFVVIDIEQAQAKTESHIDIDNHHDGGSFSLYHELVDTVTVVEVANKFVREKHGIIIIQVNDKLYINGELLENEDNDFLEDNEKEQLDRFSAFMESFLVAKVFEDSLEDADDKTNGK